MTAGWGIERTMTCRTCGAKLTDRDRFCAACGMPNTEGKLHPRFGPVAEPASPYPEPRPAAEGEILCARCERPSPRTDEYCTWCGMDMQRAVLAADRGPTDGVWSTAGPSGTVPFRPLRALTAPLRIVLHVAAVTALVALCLLAARFVTLEGGDVAGLDLATLRTWSDTTLWVLAILGVVAFVLLVAWTRRASTNLQALLVRDARFPAWVGTWCWFLPLANLVLPYLVVEDLWRASGPDGPPLTARRRFERPPFAVHLWWPCAVLGSLLLMIARAAMPGAGAEPATWRVVLVLGAIGALVLAVGAMALPIVVDEVRARQARRAEDLGPPSWLEDHRPGGRGDADAPVSEEPEPVELRRQEAGPTWGRY